MIIVSQDKYNILNFDTTVNIGVEEISTLNDIVQISAQTNGNTIVLGKYETEERAKEVLQEIVNKYTEYVTINNPKQGAIGIYDRPKVYEMPEI